MFIFIVINYYRIKSLLINFPFIPVRYSNDVSYNWLLIYDLEKNMAIVRIMLYRKSY